MLFELAIFQDWRQVVSHGPELRLQDDMIACQSDVRVPVQLTSVLESACTSIPGQRSGGTACSGNVV